MSAARTLDRRDWDSVKRHFIYPVAGAVLGAVLDRVASGTFEPRVLAALALTVGAAALGRVVRRYFLALDDAPPSPPSP